MQVFSFPVRFFQIQAMFFDFQSGFFKSRQVGKFFFFSRQVGKFFHFQTSFFHFHASFLSNPVRFFQNQSSFFSQFFFKSRQVSSNPGKFFPFPVSFFFICRQAALPDRRVWTPIRRRAGVLGSGLEPGGALLLDDLCPAQEHRGDPGNSGVPGNRWSRRRRGKRGKTF